MKLVYVLIMLLGCQTTAYDTDEIKRDSTSHLVVHLKITSNDLLNASTKQATLTFAKKKITQTFTYNEISQSYQARFSNLSRHNYDSVELKFIDEDGVLIALAMTTDIKVDEYGDNFLELNYIKYL